MFVRLFGLGIQYGIVFFYEIFWRINHGVKCNYSLMKENQYSFVQKLKWKLSIDDEMLASKNCIYCACSFGFLPNLFIELYFYVLYSK